MRLTKQVAKLEAAAERTISVAAAPMGIVWTQHETRIDGGSLLPGEFIAVDMYLGGVVCPEELGGSGPATRMCRVVERKTRRMDDLGLVFEGEEGVGMVTEINGSLLSWRYLEDAGGGAN